MADPPRSARWVVSTALLAGLSTPVAGLAMGAAVAVGDDQAEAVRAVTALVADRFSTTLASLSSSLFGVDGLAVDGEVPG